MKWLDFLEKLKTFKKECASRVPGEEGKMQMQLNLNAGSLSTLLFAGAFDSMIERTIITYKDYHELCQQMKDALGSDAELPSAKKNESLGIADIDSEIKLNMWRYQANPLHKFSLDEHFRGFLEAEGFIKSNTSGKKMIFRRPAPDSDQMVEPKFRQREVEIWSSWKYVFENNQVFRHHSMYTEASGRKHYPDTKLGFLGMMQSVQARPLKDGRESFTFRLFLGGETTDEIRVWSNDQGFVPHAIRQYLKNGSVGVGIVNINKYNDKPSGSLREWIPAGKWEST